MDFPSLSYLSLPRVLLLSLLLATHTACSDGPTALESCSPLSYPKAVATEIRRLREEDKWEESAELLRPYAEQGDRYAQLGMAMSLLKAQPEEGFSWGMKSAKNGCIEGALLVGMAYQEGMGVKEDASKSFEWYHKAAVAGSRTAGRMVSHMYFEGIGVEMNEDLGLYWLNLPYEK